MDNNKSHTRWTPTQEKIVLEAVKLYPHNLSFAFMMSATALGRTQGAVAFKWYTKLRKGRDIYTTTTDYVSVGNTKNHLKKNIPQESVLKRFLINVGNIFRKRRERVSQRTA